MEGPITLMPLLQAIDHACGNVDVGAYDGWICHYRRFFAHYLAREMIACDVDEMLWLDHKWRQDAV